MHGVLGPVAIFHHSCKIIEWLRKLPGCDNGYGPTATTVTVDFHFACSYGYGKFSLWSRSGILY